MSDGFVSAKRERERERERAASPSYWQASCRNDFGGVVVRQPPVIYGQFGGSFDPLCDRNVNDTVVTNYAGEPIRLNGWSVRQAHAITLPSLQQARLSTSARKPH